MPGALVSSLDGKYWNLQEVGIPAAVGIDSWSSPLGKSRQGNSSPQNQGIPLSSSCRQSAAGLRWPLSCTCLTCFLSTYFLTSLRLAGSTFLFHPNFSASQLLRLEDPSLVDGCTSLKDLILMWGRAVPPRSQTNGPSCSRNTGVGVGQTGSES